MWIQQKQRIWRLEAKNGKLKKYKMLSFMRNNIEKDSTQIENYKYHHINFNP